VSKTHDTPDRESFNIPQIHRNEKTDEKGVSQVVLEQFVHHQLPFLLKVKVEMDAGKILSDAELELLTRAVERAHNINAFVYLHPELKELVARVIDLVHDITGEALHNATDSPRDQ